MELLSKFYATPFYLRLLLVLALLSALAMVDWLRKGPKATRPGEYLFWVLAGLLGAAFAAVNDAITSGISVEYFLLGKGIEAGPSFFLDVTCLAFEAGFLAGILAGGTTLMANNSDPSMPRLGYKSLSLFLSWPIGGALLMTPLGALMGWQDVFGSRADLVKVMSDAEAGGFLTVQGIHTGLYLGGAVGTVMAAVKIRRMRRKLAGSPIDVR